MLDQPALNALSPPDHLRQLPEDVVAQVVATILAEIPFLPHILALELRAFAETKTVHDARRVVSALRHAYAEAGLAADVEDRLAALKGEAKGC